MKIKPIEILMADDDVDDQLLTQKALKKSRLLNNMHFVNNGEELMNYLLHRDKFADKERHPSPDLILLDLNMPRLDGREALKLIKDDPHLRRIPVIILTTSRAEKEIIASYDLGANSFITKPVDFSEFLDAMRVFSEYWISIVRLPTYQN